MGAQLQGVFNAQQFDPTQGVPAMPLGRHPVIIHESSIKTNRDGQGGHVEFGLTIIDGPNKGQQGAYRLNLYHQNPKTVEIAQRQLSALSYVTGVLQFDNTEALHNKPFVVEVTAQNLTQEQLAQQAAGANVTPYTQVSKVFYMDGREPGKEGQAPAQAQPMAQQPPQGFQPPQQQQAPAAAGAWQAPGGAAPAPQPPQQPQGGNPAVSWGAPPAGVQGGAAPAPAPAAGAWQAPGGAAPAPAPAAGGWSQGAPAAAGGAARPNWGR